MIQSLSKSIKRSCEIKLRFTERDFTEKGLRMSLNFGHTFAHALEIKNNYSNKLNHGEAVLIGMIIATRISLFKKLCNKYTYSQIEEIYKKNSLLNNLNKHLRKEEILNSIKFMKNDKKKDDEKISLILLKTIGKTTMPGKYKFDSDQITKIVKKLF